MSDNKNGESERVVYLSNSSAPKAMNPVDQSNTLSKEGKKGCQKPVSPNNDENEILLEHSSDKNKGSDR